MYNDNGKTRMLQRCLIAAGLIAASATFEVSAGQVSPDPAGGNYPERPVRLVVPFAPGAGTDITARTIALKLASSWGQNVVVDNRPGAAGSVGVDLVVKSAPDGYTLSMITSSHTVNASVDSKLPYDLGHDLSPVTQATVQVSVLVINPGLPAKSVKELIALAKAKPGTLHYGSSGTGGLSHFAGALLGYLAGIEITHVPYKGGSPALNEVIGGHIQMIVQTLLQAQPHIKSGRLRALAVTSAKRSRAVPELPTMAEAGVPGYEVTGWYGIVAPPKTPRAIVTRLNREIVKVLHTQEVRERLAAAGSEVVGSSPEEFGAHINSEVAKWSKVAKQAGVRIE